MPDVAISCENLPNRKTVPGDSHVAALLGMTTNSVLKRRIVSRRFDKKS